MNVRTPSDIARLIRDQRRKLRVSQHELAHRINASRQWVQNLEQGRQGLELGLTLRALAALGLSLDVREPAAGAIAAPDAAGRRGLVLRATTVDGLLNATAARKRKGEHRTNDGQATKDRAMGVVPAERPGSATQTPRTPGATPRKAAAEALRSLLRVNLDSIVSANTSNTPTQSPAASRQRPLK